MLVTNWISFNSSKAIQNTDSKWVSCGSLCFSVTCSISTKLSNLYVYTCLFYSLNIISISVGTIVISIFHGIIICILSLFLLLSLNRYLTVFVIFSKKKLFVSLIFSYCFCAFNLNDFYSFILFSFLGFLCLNFLVSQGEYQDLWLNSSLFSDISIKCCKFPSEHFRQVPQIFISCIFIFIRFNVYYFIILRLPLWPMEYLKVH